MPHVWNAGAHTCDCARMQDDCDKFNTLPPFAARVGLDVLEKTGRNRRNCEASETVPIHTASVIR